MNVVAALTPVIEALEKLRVAYDIGGSVASSLHGTPRSTNDVDVVADLEAQHVYDRVSKQRNTRRQLEGSSGRMFLVATPEDVLLRKLQWFRAGGETSDRQWRDVLGVMRAQGENLDHAYLDLWAPELEVDDLLARARREIAAG